MGKLLLFILLIAAAAAGWLWYSINYPYQGFSPEGVFVEVPHGSSSRSVARLLERIGIVRSSIAFEIYARRHPRRSLQAGEYFFDRATSAHDVFWKLANGQVFEQPFTVREGETIFDIARDLEAGKFMPASEFLRAAKDPALIQDIAPKAATLEGFLFPATYHLSRHPSATALTADMVRKFKEEWNAVTSLGSTRDVMTISGAAEQTLEDFVGAEKPTASTRPVVAVVTLASLIERETPRAEERPVVAGVFENRLHKNMLLQCDPTVIYALEQQGRYNGTLSTADLHIDSPYNSYTHTGLPPGPIGNPGAASLRAAYLPAHTDYLYFVANTQGGHFFSATLAEHNNNVIKYRRLLAGEQASTR
ncbi:MAG TPA: endolytic transglycosylase MltG [Candidatus Acidoferrum sp.]|nr:endolytic transglycosylase MltG [Candidatus Acidoferrum sp.]